MPDEARPALRFVNARVATLVASVALCVALVATIWVVRGPGQQEAAGQEATTPAPALPTTESPASLHASVPALFPELTEGFFSASAEPVAEGIPGLSVMVILGNLKHFPVEGRFVCRGPVPGDEAGSNLWMCSASAEKQSPAYEVTVVGDDPRTVLWVRATVRGATEEEASEFFGYVAELCLRATDDPLNPDAWVDANVASGGQVFVGGAEFTVYGTKEERTLQVVANDPF
jgi:hypothetical protein